MNSVRSLFGTMLLYLKGGLLGDAQARDVLRWRKIRGDQTLRLNYPLSASDVVFDLGGHIGHFAAEVHRRHDCIVYVFEPVQSFFAACEERFAGNEKIRCLNFGLATSQQTVQISIDGDASSIKRDTTGHLQTIQLESFNGFLERSSVREVALLKINIEGGEFDVLEHLIETGSISRMWHVQIQFHKFAEDAVARRDRIRTALAKTHRLEWDYYFVWESWSRL